MSKVKQLLGLVIFLALVVTGIGFADHDEKRKHDKHEKSHHSEGKKASDHDGEDYLKPISNTVYKEQCGACHFTYQAALLPSESWKKILAQPDKHFDQSFDISVEQKGAITAYLETNAADRSGTEISRKIVKSLDGQIPIRITEIPYIRNKHRKIDQDVLKLKSVGSLSNCSACHKRAEDGYFDDDNVVIPQ